MRHDCLANDPKLSSKKGGYTLGASGQRVTPVAAHAASGHGARSATEDDLSFKD